MKKPLLLSTMLLTMAFATKAQIPNNGFEEWTTVGGHEDPNGWATMNGFSGTSFNSCTKSTDHYPTGIGQYSVRLENNTALGQFTGGYGAIVTEAFTYPFQPSFPVSGNPTSFHGYFKYTSLNADRAWVKLVLFLNGAIVADESYVSEAQSYSEWTPFEIQLDNYGDADSATIMLFAFYPESQTDGPNGNSVLWVDNLSFNSPITSVAEPMSRTSFTLYPNPAVNHVTLSLDNTYGDGHTVTVYSMLGSALRSEAVRGDRHQIDLSALPSGIYMVELRSEGVSEFRRLQVVR